MKKRHTILLSTGLSLFCFGLAWILRGYYDSHFLLEGHLHLSNPRQESIELQLRFPSGYETQLQLKQGESRTLYTPSTGEGSIQIHINQRETHQLGYVTSLNGMIVLQLSNPPHFSQVFDLSKNHSLAF